MTPIVAFHDVSKWYGNVIGLNKLTLRIPAGVTGLLGPNGAGKSTLLQLATGQLYPSQGTVRRSRPARVEQFRLESLHRALPGARCVLRMDDRLRFRANLRRLSGMRRAGCERRRRIARSPRSA